MAEEVDVQKLQLHDDSLLQQQQQLLLSPYRADQPLIVFDGHPHPLVFLENHRHHKVGPAMCGACDKPAVGESPHRPLLFHCPACSNFNLHLFCGPLPCSLKQGTHLETLVLKDSHIPDVMGDDEFYCDSCEELREPRECVYYCKRCDYSAEIKCVMPEIIYALTGKCGDVSLRTIGRWNHSGKVASKGLSAEEIREHRIRVEGLKNPPGMISLGDLEQSLNETEKKRLNDILDSEGELLGALSRETHHEAFMELVAELDASELTRTLRGNWHSNIQFVQVGDNLAPHKLVSVYDDLHKRYGDVSEESSLSPKLKAFFFLYLCRTVEKMWEVMVLDATKDELSTWWIALRVVRTAGFRIQFAINAIRRALCAYCELQRIKRVNDLESTIASGESYIQSKQAEQSETEKKLEQYEEDIRSEKCSIARECLEEAAPALYEMPMDMFFGSSDFDISAEVPLRKPSARDVSPDHLRASGCHQHSLPLVQQKGPVGNGWHCSICKRGFTECDTIYKCSDSSHCTLMVDSRCSGAIRSIIEYFSHEHPRLFYLDESFHHPIKFPGCNFCGEEITPGSPIFKCGECSELMLHQQCGPFPAMIKLHASGYDLNMTFENHLILGDDPEDIWCDVCEEKRDPEKPVYYSLNPPFVATIDCAMPQIKLALGGSLGEVRLREVKLANWVGRVISQQLISSSSEEEDTIMHPENAAEEDAVTDLNSGNKVEFEINPGNVIATWTHEQILQSLSDQEKVLTGYYTAASGEVCSKSTEETAKDADDFPLNLSHYEYSDTAFQQFKEELNKIDRLQLSSIIEDMHDEVEYYEFQDGLILPSVVVQLELHQQYPDIFAAIFADDRFTPRVKALMGYTLLLLLSFMLPIRVFGTSKILLVLCLGILNCMHNLTDARFWHDAKNKFVRIYFGMIVRNFKNDLNEKLQQLPREIDEKKAELEKLKARLEHYKGIPLKESTTWKQYQKEARTSKWKKVGELI